MRVLAVDDAPQSLRYVRDALIQSGYAPILTGDPEEAVRLMERERPQLALLDLMLPDADGIELMQSILEIADMPVIFLSAYERDDTIARALEMGAVDYMVKPFAPTELTARIGSAFRLREVSEPSKPYVLGDLTIDYSARSVALAGRPVYLTATEYRMLAELSASAGRVLTYQHLLETVWGEKGGGGMSPMRTIVGKLRSKLGNASDNPTYIFTESRVGYRMPKGGGGGTEGGVTDLGGPVEKCLYPNLRLPSGATIRPGRPSSRPTYPYGQALEAHKGLSQFKYEVFLQGSYKNGTNLGGDSDVDVVVRLSSKLKPHSGRPYRRTATENGSHKFAYTQWKSFRDETLKALRARFGKAAKSGRKTLKVPKAISRRTPTSWSR